MTPFLTNVIKMTKEDKGFIIAIIVYIFVTGVQCSIMETSYYFLSILPIITGSMVTYHGMRSNKKSKKTPDSNPVSNKNL